jgi:hypothetical protein
MIAGFEPWRSTAFRIGVEFSRPEGEQMAVKPIPEGYHSLTPYLAVEDAAKAI